MTNTKPNDHNTKEHQDAQSGRIGSDHNQREHEAKESARPPLNEHDQQEHDEKLRRHDGQK